MTPPQTTPVAPSSAADARNRTSSRPAPRDPALDGLRGVAILMVFIFHYGGGLKSTNPIIHALGVMTEAGWIGVVLFFALSGFLITGSLWDSFTQPHWLRNFYARRALRILPLYLFVILLCAFLAIGRGTRFDDLHAYPIYLFFLQNLPFLAARALDNPSPLPLYHLWSLAVEEQFYLCWPVLLLTVRNRRRGALRLSLWAFAVCVAFRLSVYGLPSLAFTRQAKLFDTFLLTQGGALALGAAVALALRSSKTGRVSNTNRLLNRHAVTFFFLGVAIFLLSSLFCKSFYLTLPLQFMVGLPAISVACAAVIPILLRPGLPCHLFAFAPLRWLGRISYGFYVFHVLLQPIFDYLATHLTHTASGSYYQLIRLLVAFPLTLLVAALSFYFLEQPFLQRKRRFPMHQPLPLKEQGIGKRD